MKELSQSTRRTREAAIQALEPRLLLAALDPTWNGSGVQDAPFTNAGAVKSVATLATGKVLALVATADEDTLVRYNADGSLDSTFGNTGLLTLTTRVSQMVVRGDGEIFLAKPGGIEARKPDGSINPDFPVSGVSLINQGDYLADLRLALAPDGSLYAVGVWVIDSDPEIPEDEPYYGAGVVRFSPQGRLDHSFGVGAVTRLDTSDREYIELHGLAVQPDGHVMIEIRDVGERLYRLAPDGTIEQQRFGSLRGFVLLEDGKVLARDQDSETIRRFNADLSVDKFFGEQGIAEKPALGSLFFVTLLGVDSAGRALAIGSVRERPPFLLRWKSDGSLDDSFAPGGAAPLHIDDVDVISVQPDERILLGTNTSLLRVNPDATAPSVQLVGSTLTVSGTIGNDTIAVAASGANLELTRNGATTSFPASHVEKLSIDADSGNDMVTVSADVPALIYGGSGDNSLTGGGGADSVFCGSGRDTIVGGAGDDSLVAGDGDNTIDSGDGADTVSSGEGDDSVTCGEAGRDGESHRGRSVFTGDGNDTITVGSGADSIYTSGGDDRIAAGTGADYIDAGDGNNHVQLDQGFLFIGSGDDTLIGGDGGIHVGDEGGNDSLMTGAGDDTIDALSGADTISTGAGDDRVNTGAGGPTSENDLIDAGAGNDTIEASHADDSISGGPGDDRIFGGNGDNLLLGGEGNDFLQTGAGSDTLWGEIGNDSLRGGRGNDLMNGGAGKDRMWGQQGNDRLYGRRSNDALDGGPGRDRLFGDDGNDKLFDRDGTADSLDGGLGNDIGRADDPVDELLDVETVLP
jgi:uncharacterized delta-60 repeat protein